MINVIALFTGDLRLPSTRTRGLTEAACLVLAQEVRGSKTIAYCYRDGEPDPGLPTRSHGKERPPCDDCRAPVDVMAPAWKPCR